MFLLPLLLLGIISSIATAKLDSNLRGKLACERDLVGNYAKVI